MNGIFRTWALWSVAIAVIALFPGCGSSEKDVATNLSAIFRDSGAETCEAPGYANEPRIELAGPAGTAYTVAVVDGGNWCWTSRNTHATTIDGTLVSTTGIVYLYLAENTSGQGRTATIAVTLGNERFTLTLQQQDYMVPAVMDRAWAELPAYLEKDDCLYITHYAPLSSTVTARNFTMRYNTTKRIAEWVAYPLHACYRQGTYTRTNPWAYDPEIDSRYQANLSSGSYRGGGIRGHQCMSNHRYVAYNDLLNDQTYYSSNIMPQDYDFNGGSWLSMENLATSYICRDTLYIVTGNYGVQSWSTDRSGTKVAMPEYCWKVLLRTRSGRTGKRIDQIEDASELMSIGFWAANDKTSKNGLEEYITTVADIERKTGYKFFPMLDDAIAEQVKSQKELSAWGIN